MDGRENWHERVISEICAKMTYLMNLTEINVSKKQKRGSDIEIVIKKNKRKINIEVQQFDSGAGWKTKTIPSWENRHDLFTFIIFTEPTIERIVKLIPQHQEYNFFRRDDVFLFSETQIQEIVSFIGTIVLTKDF